MRIPIPVLILLAALIARPAQAGENWLYLTSPGDTLSQIGQTYLKDPRDWPKVQAANGVPIPKHLPANQRIQIPVELLKVTPAPVTVTAVTGNVRYKKVDGPFQKLSVGTLLNGGESVLTGPRSSATYRLADGGVLTQQATSKLGFGRLAAYGKTGMVSTELSLDSGRMEAHAAKQLAPAGGFRIVTPVAVAGLRGTDFRLNVDEAGKTLRNEVLEGTVAVSAQGQEVRVAGGYGTLAEAGKPPEPPRTLLPAPQATGLGERIERLPVVFTWPALAGAHAYRAQVASDASFSEVLLDNVTTEPTITWNDNLPDGHYVLRLRGIDEVGLEGGNLDHPFELDARPLPPEATAPAPGERMYRNDVSLTWSTAAEAQGYLLQIAPTAEFTDGVIERRLPAVIGQVEPLPNGVWHWRLASLDETGKAHAWSPEHTFRVQSLPNPPVAAASANAGQAEFTWAASKGATRYQLELGADASLETPLVSQETTETALTLPLKGGAYFWRVRGVESDGKAGAWSHISPIIVPPVAPTQLTVQVAGKQVLAAWQGDAAGYQVEIDSDPGFVKPLLTQRVNELRIALPAPEPGDYWLRVRSLGADGAPGAASPPQAIRIDSFTPWWLLIPIFLVP
jgi:hypothetical protein